MGTVQELNLKQASQSESTIDEIKRCDPGELLKWFDINRPKALTSKSRDKFEGADIDGTTFLDHAGDMKYFHEGCKLPIGTSERLARLAAEIVGGETAGIKSKLPSFMSCTLRRQQANNVTGNRQQAENVEMSAAADSAGKSTDHAPLLFSYANPYYCRAFNSQSVPLQFASKVDYGLPSRIP